MASSLLASYPQSTWDAAAVSLRDNSGLALIELDDITLQQISKTAFESTLSHLAMFANDFSQHISPLADAAHATGYHGASDASSMSRYNQFREGLVFSDGNKLKQCSGDAHADDDDDDDRFKYASLQKYLNELEDMLHCIAEHVCRGIERELGLSEGWFQANFGPTRCSSQWHVKRYLPPIVQTDADTVTEDNYSTKNLLPIHTDPSLISIIIHDRPGKQTGAQGLQYSHTGADGTRQYINVSHSGHAVAVVFVGSVLGHVTGNYYPACRHYVAPPMQQQHRMAATLFLRPSPHARLVVPPSLQLRHVKMKRNDMTFGEWNMRVSKRYMKGNGKTLACNVDGKQAEAKQCADG
ncbi:hypothetical protein MPSEU_000155600 [Mayamaea pseudoterrestris]|nr:hypothetical protein MPSEU_000155600 [Mayamaea pseudoterrestris]